MREEQHELYNQDQSMHDKNPIGEEKVETPKMISVVMSAYNEPEGFLRESIESILNQTYPHFEFIIIQDKPDNEAIERVVNEYAAKDSRIRFYKNEKNIGLAMSLNRGIELARYDIIARMDADDIALPERFEKEIAYLEAHPKVRLVSTNWMMIDENGNQVRPARRLPETFEEAKKILDLENPILHPSVLVFKKDLEDIGGYRKFPAAQDYELWLRYVSKEWEFGFIHECLFKYRISSSNISVQNCLKQWVCRKYAKKLLRERQKKGVDSYSEEALNEVMRKAGCFDKRSTERFSKGRLLIFDGGTALRNHHYWRTTINVLRALPLHKEMPSFIVYVFKWKLIEGF